MTKVPSKLWPSHAPEVCLATGMTVHVFALLPRQDGSPPCESAIGPFPSGLPRLSLGGTRPGMTETPLRARLSLPPPPPSAWLPDSSCALEAMIACAIASRGEVDASRARRASRSPIGSYGRAFIGLAQALHGGGSAPFPLPTPPHPPPHKRTSTGCIMSWVTVMSRRRTAECMAMKSASWLVLVVCV